MLNKNALIFFLAIMAGGAAYIIMSPFVSSPSSDSCVISTDRRTVLTEHIQGDVSSFRVLDESVSARNLIFASGDGVVRPYNWDSPRLVLMNLWATWCAPCREEMPWLDELAGSLGGDDFAVIPVSLDTGSIQKPRDFYESVGLRNLDLYHDPDLALLDFMKRHGLALGLPATFLIESGCVLGVLSGPAHWSGSDAKSLISSIL